MTDATVLGFNQLLHDLIGLVGEPVTVIACAFNGHGVLTTSGRLVGGTVVNGEVDSGDEAFYFPLDTGAYNGAQGFLITRQNFGGAVWIGGALHIALGPIGLQIEPHE